MKSIVEDTIRWTIRFDIYLSAYRGGSPVAYHLEDTEKAFYDNYTMANQSHILASETPFLRRNLN